MGHVCSTGEGSGGHRCLGVGKVHGAVLRLMVGGGRAGCGVGDARGGGVLLLLEENLVMEALQLGRVPAATGVNSESDRGQGSQPGALVVPKWLW